MTTLMKIITSIQFEISQFGNSSIVLTMYFKQDLVEDHFNAIRPYSAFHVSFEFRITVENRVNGLLIVIRRRED